MASISDILTRKWPNAQWAMRGDSYETLQWHPANVDPKPTLAAITAFSTEVDASMIRAQIAAKRLAVETGGMTWNGYPLHTAREDRAVLHQEYTAAKDGTRIDGEFWKFRDDFRPVTNQEVIDMTLAVRNFVRACFVVEKEKLAALALGQPVDIDSGWPNGG